MKLSLIAALHAKGVAAIHLIFVWKDVAALHMR
jgi:hypothetical protein